MSKGGFYLEGSGGEGHDCWPLHWLSIGLLSNSSTCLATSMVSSRSKSPSASSMESLLSHHGQKRSHPQWQTTHILYTSNHLCLSVCLSLAHTHTLPKQCSVLHRWVNSIVLRVTSRNRRSAVIHVGGVSGRVGIGCGEPATREHRRQRLPKQRQTDGTY